MTIRASNSCWLFIKSGLSITAHILMISRECPFAKITKPGAATFLKSDPIRPSIFSIALPWSATSQARFRFSAGKASPSAANATSLIAYVLSVIIGIPSLK
jgi:hypothetical protein